jgi:hypothetical protein
MKISEDFKCVESEYEKKFGTLTTIREVKIELPNWEIHFLSPKTCHAVYG